MSTIITPYFRRFSGICSLAYNGIMTCAVSRRVWHHRHVL